jgi:hypothetical protein
MHETQAQTNKKQQRKHKQEPKTPAQAQAQRTTRAEGVRRPVALE